MVDITYNEMYKELCKGEEIIKDNLNRTNSYDECFGVYGVLKKDWVLKAKKLLSKNKFKKGNNNLNYNDICPQINKRSFEFFGTTFDYRFQENFILVTENFINLIRKFLSVDDQNKNLNKRLYNIFIGGNCIIRKDKSNNHNLIEYYITLSYDENRDNCVDYFLVFIDENQAINHINLILSSGFSLYIDIISYSSEEKIKEIKDDTNNETIGYFVRNCSEKRSRTLIQTNNNSVNNKEIKNVINQINNLDINKKNNLFNINNTIMYNTNLMNGNAIQNMNNNMFMNMNNKINNQANLIYMNNFNNINYCIFNMICHLLFRKIFFRLINLIY